MLVMEDTWGFVSGIKGIAVLLRDLEEPFVCVLEVDDNDVFELA